MARTDAILTTEEIEIIQDIVDNGLSLETDVTGTLPINNGGTGATTASGARTNLGVAYGTTAGTVLEGNKDAEYVKLTGTQTITGAKDFTGGITKNGQTVGEPDFYKYRIVTSVSSGNLTVALKNYLGNDPSTSVPVKVQIGGVVRTITAPVNRTINAGVNSFNAGSSELAGKEIDYFVYIGYTTAFNVVTMGISRIPYATIRSDFSTSETNEKYCVGAASANTTDSYQNIGRFNATLSASPGYTWSIPATSVILNRPVYETRLLDYTIALTGFSTVTQGATNNKYRIVGDRLELHLNNNIGGTSNATSFTFTIPFSYNGTLNARDGLLPVFVKDNGSNQSTLGHYYVSSTGNNTSIRIGKSFYNGAWTASGDKQVYTSEFTYNI